MKHFIMTLMASYILFNSTVSHGKHRTQPKTTTHSMNGIASWYGYESGTHYQHRPKTASGEYFSPYQFTAAHKTLPFGTKVKVTNKSNNKSVIVKINDRGPFVRNRIIDLSKVAAQKIKLNGVGAVTIAFAK